MKMINVKIILWLWESVNIRNKMGTLDYLNNVNMRECIMKNCENVRNISECESEKNVNRRELEFDQMWIWLGICE